jgi:hypothetical protein
MHIGRATVGLHLMFLKDFDIMCEVDKMGHLLIVISLLTSCGTNATKEKNY